MEANIKVQQYLDDLRRDEGGGESLKTVRGPGQISNDPLQFVSTKSGDNMAQRARMLVTATEQQKRQREEKHEKTQSRLMEDEEDWQADLDTWRRKRKTKTESGSTATTPTTPPFPTIYGSSVDYGISRKNPTKEDILTIRSPEDSHDSGIENRTFSHSPSTSVDFSPRSVELTSPKSLEVLSPPAYAPPPPPPLDQVLIPLSTPAVASIRQSLADEQEDYPLPPNHLRRSQDSDLLSSNRARVSASFAAPPRHRLEPFVAQSLREHGERTVNADLTVELNREQKAHVSATKYPGKYTPLKEERQKETNAYIPRNFEEKPSVVSTARHTFDFGRLATSASSPTIPREKPVYRAVDIPFDDSAATYQPPKKDKDGLMTIVVEMAGQPVHKGFGFTVTTERRRCFVDSVIVGTPADRQGILIGDRIESINGEKVEDKYPSAVNRILHEAARNGEVVLRVERNHSKSSFGSTPNLAAPVGSKFNQARSVFSEKHTDSYAEFKRKHTKGGRDKPAPREFNSLPRSSSTGFISNDYEYDRSSDYRVTSLHEKAKPGKLDDFVPEVERGPITRYDSVGHRNNFEETRTIRNYELIGEGMRKESVVRKNSDEEQDDDTLPGKAYLESRDWRNVINQQRQATPGERADKRKIQEATSSLSNLPDIIDKKLEEQKRLTSDRMDYQYGRSLDRREPREIYERSEYSYYEKKYTPSFDHLRPTFEKERKQDYAYMTKEMKETQEKERQVSTLTKDMEEVKIEKQEKKKAVVREPENARDQVVAVSGKHRCAHCGEELGRGAAMIVESLNLFYHLSCFKCYVCKTPLGSGNTGADVRVREGRLHCQSCYSSDRVQLSKV